MGVYGTHSVRGSKEEVLLLASLYGLDSLLLCFAALFVTLVSFYHSGRGF